MRWSHIMTLALGTALVGCGGVTSSHPVGDEVPSIEVSEWEGSWSSAGESEIVFVVEVEDPAEALLKVTMFPNQPPSPTFLRSTGSDLFVSIAIDLAPEGFHWFRVAMQGDSMLVWQPDASKLGQLVDDGTLPGKTSDGKVELEKLSAKNMALITSEQKGVLFDWKNPLVLRRVSP